MTADKVLEVARGQIGVTESPANSNNVLYNTAYYGQEVHDGLWGTKFPWCVVFLWWCFGRADASALFYGGNKTASCGTLYNYHKARGQDVGSNYKPGDIVFYSFSGGRTPEHVGILESCTASTVTTIEGNTGVGNDANGGAVMRRTRPVSYIVGAYRPDYMSKSEATEKVTYEEFLEHMNRYNEELAAKEASGYAKDPIAAMVALGITDGKRPRANTTREEVATMISRALEVTGDV